MPVLRIPTDTGLGDTLGNLGAQLSANLNPMNLIRAQDIQAQVQQRMWEVQQQQRIDAANQNAASVYRNANPFNEDPASLEVSANNIASGHADLNKSIDGVKAIGGWKANQTAADLYKTAHASDLPPDQLASDVSQILSGQKTASELANDRANAALNVNKATNTISGTNTARSATTGPQSALAAEAAASGDPTGASKLIAQGNELTAPTITGALTDPSIQAQIDQRRTQQAIAGTTPPAGQPVSSGLAAPTAVADITQKNVVAQSAPRAPTAIVPAVPPVDPLTGQPVTVAPGAAPPAGTFSQPAQGPDTAATAASTAAETGAKAAADIRVKDISDDIGGLESGQTMLRYVGLLRQAADALPNDTPMNQLQSTLMNRLFNEFGVTLTPGQSSREAFEAVAKQLIAASRKESGVQRMAGPEINYLERALPTAYQDRASLVKALDNLETKSRLGIQTGKLAMSVLGKSADGTISPQDYVTYLNSKAALNAPPTETMPPGSTPPPATTELPGSHPAPSKGVRIFRPDGTLLQ